MNNKKLSAKNYKENDRRKKEKAMSMTKGEYANAVKKASPNSPALTDSIKAFLFGGAICAFAEGISIALSKTSLTVKENKALVLVILIGITAVLTAFGVFDKIAKDAGAGTAVPITGFANSIVSVAMEFQTEGRILGTAANMFSIAGPVIVFGCTSAAAYGLIIYLLSI